MASCPCLSRVFESHWDTWGAVPRMRPYEPTKVTCRSGCHTWQNPSLLKAVTCAKHRVLDLQPSQWQSLDSWKIAQAAIRVQNGTSLGTFGLIFQQYLLEHGNVAYLPSFISSTDDTSFSTSSYHSLHTLRLTFTSIGNLRSNYFWCC
jgi:hypothetical protein